MRSLDCPPAEGAYHATSPLSPLSRDQTGIDRADRCGRPFLPLPGLPVRLVEECDREARERGQHQPQVQHLASGHAGFSHPTPNGGQLRSVKPRRLEEMLGKPLGGLVTPTPWAHRVSPRSSIVNATRRTRTPVRTANPSASQGATRTSTGAAYLLNQRVSLRWQKRKWRGLS